MSQHFMEGRWYEGLRYLLPLLAFAAGVLLAENVQYRYRNAKRIHWRQGILLAEIVILAVVGFIPQTYNMAATILVSFACAMQVQSFRKVGGYSYASTNVYRLICGAVWRRYLYMQGNIRRSSFDRWDIILV